MRNIVHFSIVLIFLSILDLSVAAQQLEQFRILIWPYDTDVLKDYPLYQNLGIGGFQIDRGAGQTERIALSIEKNFPFYAGHIADKGYLYLKGADKTAVTGKRGLLVRPYSLADRHTMDLIKHHIDKNVSDLKNGRVIAYALDDEISLGTFVNPGDVDISPDSLKWFRDWLKKGYVRIETLNEQWDADFRSFSEVFPSGFEQIRKQLPHRNFSSWNLSSWMDFRQFMDFQFSHVLSELVAYANEIDPDTPAGIVGAQGPSVWGGYDYGRLSRSVQWMEAYDIHGTNEMLRSFWHNSKKMRMRTFFSKKNLKLDSWFLWYNLLHGHQAVIAWPEGWFESINGEKKPSKYIRSLKKVFETVQGPLSKSFVDVNSIFMTDPVGIYYSHPSIQAGWAMDALVHGKTWPKRLSSINNVNQSSGVLRKVWCKTLEDLGYQYDFINYLDVKESLYDLNQKFKVIVLPKTTCLSRKEAQAFKIFVENGGVIIADYLCGIFDEHGKYQTIRALDDLFSIKRDDRAGYLNGNGITEIDAEKYKENFLDRLTFFKEAFKHKKLTVYERGTQASESGHSVNPRPGTPWGVIIKNSYGKGSAYYLNLTPIQYWSSPNRYGKLGEQWRKIVSDILLASGLQPRVNIISKMSERPLESIFWKNGQRLFLCVVSNPSDNFNSIKGNCTRIRLHFTQKVSLKNMRSKVHLGENYLFEDDFSPWEGNVYQLTFLQ